jgi:hypothetical protein
MNDLVIYVANSAAWSLGGFVVGLLLGRTQREVHEIKEALTEDDDDQEA